MCWWYSCRYTCSRVHCMLHADEQMRTWTTWYRLYERWQWWTFWWQSIIVVYSTARISYVRVSTPWINLDRVHSEQIYTLRVIRLRGWRESMWQQTNFYSTAEGIPKTNSTPSKWLSIQWYLDTRPRIFMTINSIHSLTGQITTRGERRQWQHTCHQINTGPRRMSMSAQPTNATMTPGWTWSDLSSFGFSLTLTCGWGCDCLSPLTLLSALHIECRTPSKIGWPPRTSGPTISDIRLDAPLRLWGSIDWYILRIIITARALLWGNYLGLQW